MAAHESLSVCDLQGFVDTKIGGTPSRSGRHGYPTTMSVLRVPAQAQLSHGYSQNSLHRSVSQLIDTTDRKSLMDDGVWNTEVQGTDSGMVRDHNLCVCVCVCVSVCVRVCLHMCVCVCLLKATLRQDLFIITMTTLIIASVYIGDTLYSCISVTVPPNYHDFQNDPFLQSQTSKVRMYLKSFNCLRSNLPLVNIYY